MKRKIIVIVCLLLMFTGCQNKKETNKKNISNKEDNVKLLSDELKNVESMDFNIKDDKFIAVVSYQDKTDFLVYSLKNKKIILDETINDGPLSRAKIIILQNGYAINLGSNLKFKLYDQQFNQIKDLNLASSSESSPFLCAAISQDLGSAAFTTNDNSLCIMNLNTDEISTILTLNNDVNKLNSITELAFLDQNTLCYTGLTYLDEDAQSTGCYGTIDISKRAYTKTNSCSVELSTYENQILIHNQNEPPEINDTSCTYYYDGINGKTLNLSLQDSINATLTAEGILILNPGSKGDYLPEISINDKVFTSFGKEYEYIDKAIYYNNTLYLWGLVNDKFIFSTMEDV